MKNPEVQRFIVTNGLIQQSIDEIDLSPYSYANGALDGEVMDVEFSEAIGKNTSGRKKPMFKKRTFQRKPQRKFKGGGKVSKAFNTMRENVSERQRERLAIRKKEADVNAQLAQSMNVAQTNDAQLLASLQPQNTANNDKKTPMSTTTKVLIGVGVFALLGAVGYVVYKRKKK